MRTPSRSARILALVLLSALTACEQPAARSPQQALGSVPEQPATPGDSVLVATSAAPQALAQSIAPAPVANPPRDTPRMDTTSAESMTNSLRRIDPTLNPMDRKFLRTTLMLYTMRLQQRVMQIAQTDPEGKPPQFTDQQLLAMAYGELNGKTGQECIALGRKLAEALPPETLQAMNSLPAAGAAGSKPAQPGGL